MSLFNMHSSILTRQGISSQIEKHFLCTTTSLKIKTKITQRVDEHMINVHYYLTFALQFGVLSRH